MNAQSFKRKIQGYVGSYVNFNEEQRITFRLVYAGPVNDVPNRYRQVFSINGVSSEDSVLATRTQCLVFNVAAVEQIQPLDGNKFEQYNTSSGEINQTTPISHWDIGVTYNIGKSGFNEPCVVMYSNFGTKQNIEDGIPLPDELFDNDSPKPSELLDFITVAYDCKELRSIVDLKIAAANNKFVNNEIEPISWELVKQKISEDFPFVSTIECSRIYTYRLAKESGYKPCSFLEIRCVSPKLQNSPLARYSAFYNLLGEPVLLDGTKDENTPGIVGNPYFQILIELEDFKNMHWLPLNGWQEMSVFEDRDPADMNELMKNCSHKGSIKNATTTVYFREKWLERKELVKELKAFYPDLLGTCAPGAQPFSHAPDGMKEWFNIFEFGANTSTDLFPVVVQVFTGSAGTQKCSKIGIVASTGSVKTVDSLGGIYNYLEKGDINSFMEGVASVVHHNYFPQGIVSEKALPAKRIVLGANSVTPKQKASKKKDKKFSQEELEEYCASADHLHEALVALGSCYGLILQDLNLHALTPPLSGVNAQHDWFVIHEHGSIGSSDYYSVSLDFNDDPNVVKVEVCYRHFTRSGEYVKQKTKMKYSKVNKASKVETLYFNAAKILVNMAQARLMLD